MPQPAPRFLQALDHVLPSGNGYLSRCPYWGCHRMLLIDAVEGEWRFTCQDHTHGQIAAYLELEDLRVDSRPATRVWLALMLATTPDTWAGLILGLPVQTTGIDPDELERQRKAGLWS